MLLDSNIIIYAFEPDYPEVERFLETGHFAASEGLGSAHEPVVAMRAGQCPPTGCVTPRR